MKEKVERGEQIFFKDKKTLKEEELVEKYEKLKQTGRVDKYIQKKSKKNTSRDRKVFKDVML
jgi:ribosomal RNA-processing protein 36